MRRGQLILEKRCVRNSIRIQVIEKPRQRSKKDHADTTSETHLSFPEKDTFFEREYLATPFYFARKGYFLVYIKPQEMRRNYYKGHLDHRNFDEIKPFKSCDFYIDDSIERKTNKILTIVDQFDEYITKRTFNSIVRDIMGTDKREKKPREYNRMAREQGDALRLKISDQFISNLGSNLLKITKHRSTI